MLSDFRRASMKHRVARFIIRLKFHPHAPGFHDGSRIFFVTGRSKSGTTWMAKLLNSHPSLFCDSSENCAFHQDCEFRYFADWPQLLHSQAEDFFNKRTWKLLKNGLITNLIARCDKLSSQKLGDKTPRQNILRILEMFPKTQVIIMLRDFRDACVSLAFHSYRANGTWEGCFDGPEMKTLDNRFLRDHLSNYESHKDFETYSRLASERPEQVIIVRYEDLKYKPQTTLRRAFEFLGVDSTGWHVKRVLQANKFEKLAGGRRPGESDPNSFFRKGVVGDWRNYFSAENVAIFKEIAGDTLIAAGYENDGKWGL